MFSQEQPKGTALIAILLGIYGLAISIMSFIGVLSGFTMSTLFVLMGLGWIALGYGLWNQANWARHAAIILIAFNTITLFFDGFQSNDMFGLTLATLLIIYLMFNDNVQHTFS